MTEEQAIDRIYAAIHREFGTQFDEGYDEPTVARMSKAAWNEIKAITREDALTVHLPLASEAPGAIVKAWNRVGKVDAAHISDAK